MFHTQFCSGGLIKLARFLLNSFLFFEGDLTRQLFIANGLKHCIMFQAKRQKSKQFSLDFLFFYHHDFQAKVGGWLSLAVGASAISFLELGYFLWLLASAAVAAVGRAAAGRAAAAAAAAAARSNSRKYGRRSSSMAKKVDAEEEEKEECESQMG